LQLEIKNEKQHKPKSPRDKKPDSPRDKKSEPKLGSQLDKKNRIKTR